MRLKIQATNVFNRNYNTQKRIVVNQGGTGSSKTYSLAQLFLVRAMKTSGKTFSIVRKNMPQLRPTAMKDFFTILKENDLYNQNDHDKTNNIYYLHGNELEFFGLDEPQKVRSRKRDYLWINEANEITYEAFRQLNMRTTSQIYMDYNPSDEFHWIYEKVLTREDCELLISTYKDNPFLAPEIVKEIELYKLEDINYWNIYGLGQRGVSQVRIYPKFGYVDSLPEGEEVWGLDFGFNHPTALTKVIIRDDGIYLQQIIHERYLTNSDLIKRMEDLKVSHEVYIYADAEDPNRIEELKAAGFNVIATWKGKSSVKEGIDKVKSFNIYITKDSDKGIKELQSYSWKVKGERVLDEPVKLRDDFCDSVRGAVFTHLREPSIDVDIF